MYQKSEALEVHEFRCPVQVVPEQMIEDEIADAAREMLRKRTVAREERGPVVVIRRELI